ncbi:glycosyltransferase, partial [Escherichia coli]
INGKHFDYVFVINPEALDYNTMNKLKQKCLGVNKQCYFVLYLWDSLKNKPNAPKLFPLFDKVSTFDRKDSDDFNINLIPLFYTRKFDAKYYPVQPLKYDVCFIGTAHSNRLKYLDEILKLISNNKQISKYIFLFFPSRMLFLIKKLFCNSSTKHKINFESLPSAKVVDAILSSAVVIDIHHPSQHGLTMRTIEAVGLNKKIITTNADIKKYDFYDPKDVYVYQSGDSKLPDVFLSTSTTNFKNREMYSLKCWVENNLKK